MNYKVKGMGLITVVVVGSVCLVGGAVGGYLYGRLSGGGDGFGLGGAEGTSVTIQEGEGNAEEVRQNPLIDFTDSAEELSEFPTEEVTEEFIPSTEPVTVPIIENMDTVEIVISGNGYLYRNTPVSLEAIRGILQTLGKEYTIKITDKKASLRAYNNLTDLLKEMETHYIEVTS